MEKDAGKDTAGLIVIVQTTGVILEEHLPPQISIKFHVLDQHIMTIAVHSSKRKITTPIANLIVIGID